jgi:hypothetical protein
MSGFDQVERQERNTLLEDSGSIFGLHLMHSDSHLYAFIHSIFVLVRITPLYVVFESNVTLSNSFTSIVLDMILTLNCVLDQSVRLIDRICMHACMYVCVYECACMCCFYSVNVTFFPKKTFRFLSSSCTSTCTRLKTLPQERTRG